MGSIVLSLIVGSLMLWAAIPAWIAVVASVMTMAIVSGYLTGPSRGREPEQTPAASPNQTLPDPLPSGAGIALLEALPIGVILISEARMIGFINRAASEMFGPHVSEAGHVSALRAPALLDLIEAGFIEGGIGAADVALSRGAARQLQAVVQRLDGVSVRASGRFVLVMIEDVTQARLASALQRDFVANASHELKTPLAAVSGLIETLLGHAREDPEATDRFLGMMADQTRRMTGLVEDLMSLNRIELNERVVPDESHDLIRIVREAAEALRPIADAQESQIDITCDMAACPVRADREELTQVFRNLVDNALKYGGRGEPVDVRFVENPATLPGLIGVQVRDNGPGIASEHLPRLTERFYRVSVSGSRARGGTGLGLAIVKHALNRHRGRLAIESTVGKGSTFTVWLPKLSR